MKVTTVTIWECESGRSPWTVAFDAPEKANAFKTVAEKMISESGGSQLIVTVDSNELNNTDYYLNELSEELGVDIPQTPAPEDKVPVYARYALTARYTAPLMIPREKLPEKDASQKDLQAFVDYLNEEATSKYWDADFGDAEDVDGKIIYYENKAGDFLWEDGRAFPEKIQQLKEESL